MRILFLTVDIEEKNRGIGVILKSLVVGAKKEDHEVGILVGLPFKNIPTKDKTLSKKVSYKYLQHYMLEGRDSFKYIMPGGYRKRNLAKSVLNREIIKNHFIKIDKAGLSGKKSLLHNVDFVIQIPFVYQFISRNKSRIVRTAIKKACKDNNIDLVVSVSPTTLRAKDIRPTKLVQFVHDIMPLEILETPPDNDTPVRYAEQYMDACVYSDAVWVNSKDTASKVLAIAPNQDVEVLYGAPSNKKDSLSESAILINKGLKTNEYLLFISALEKRKNLETLFEAYTLAYERLKMPLVIVGSPGYGIEDILEKHASLPEYIQNNIIFTGYVSESDKHTLYQHARAFILPSVYEGLGLMLLEAFQYKLPVLTTAKGALMESGGKAAYYVDDPYDSIEISEAIIRIATDNILREELISHMPEQLNKFTQEKFDERLTFALSNLNGKSNK